MKIPRHHRPAFFLACALGMTAGLVPPSSAEDNPLLPLPVWTEQDKLLLNDEPESVPLGGLLWPDGFGPESLRPPDLSPMRMPPEGLLDGGSSGMFAPRRTEGFLLF